MTQDPQRPQDDRDDRSLAELDEARLDEVKGGALNAYMSTTGETQGKVEGAP